MPAFSFDTILIFKNRITTPPTVKIITGQTADTYAHADRIYMHFSNVHTTDQSKALLSKVAAVAPAAQGGICGDELVISVPQSVFQQKFQGAEL